jgi:hypothetical protein
MHKKYRASCLLVSSQDRSHGKRRLALEGA